eukprot:9468264-Pyramimonas_sp.AAC.1
MLARTRSRSASAASARRIVCSPSDRASASSNAACRVHPPGTPVTALVHAPGNPAPRVVAPPLSRRRARNGRMALGRDSTLCTAETGIEASQSEGVCPRAFRVLEL